MYPATTGKVAYQPSLPDALCAAPSQPPKAEYCIPGHGSALPSCGEVRAVVYCPNCDYQELQQEHCDRGVCPICRKKWLSRRSGESAERMFQASRLIRQPVHHVVFSCPKEDYHLSLKQLRTRLYYRLKKAGVVGAMVIFHPFRFRAKASGSIIAWKHCSLNQDAEEPIVDCYADYGPHFHLLCTGYLMRSDKFEAQYGWVYKKLHYKKPLRTLNEFRNTIYYCLSHCGIHENYHAYTYWGKFSNTNMHISESWIEYDEVKCPVCKETMLLVRPEGCVSRSTKDSYGIHDHCFVHPFVRQVQHRIWAFSSG